MIRSGLNDQIVHREATPHRKEHIKFAGPLKILVVERRGAYWKTICCAFAVGLAHLLIGATNMTLLMYSLSTRDLHTVMCGSAFHLFAAEAILALNYVNGWSTPMRLWHRITAHVVLQLLGIIFACVGTTMVTIYRGIPMHAHAISSVVAMGFLVTSLLIGPCAYANKRYCKTVHICFGILAFIAASVSFITGIFKPGFSKWLENGGYPSVKYILVVFVSLTSTIIILATIIRLKSRFRR